MSKPRPKVTVKESRLWVLQWRYLRKWIPIEVYSTIPDARRQLWERRRACPPDKVKRFRLVMEYHWEETRTIHKTNVLPV